MNEILTRFKYSLAGWFEKSKNKIFYFTALSVILRLFSDLPYLNLIFTPRLIVSLIAILIIIFFSPKSNKRIFIIGIGLTLLSLVFTLSNGLFIAEEIGNLAYFIFLFGILRIIFGKGEKE